MKGLVIDFIEEECEEGLLRTGGMASGTEGMFV